MELLRGLHGFDFCHFSHDKQDVRNEKRDNNKGRNNEGRNDDGRNNE